MADRISDSHKDKKIALTVGIDTYEDPEIPILSGAQNDAKELFELLSSKTGGFVNDKSKCLLLGDRATQRNIMKEIAEIFRQDENFYIALFYFSGHGFIDNNKDLYLSTYDIDKEDPYIGGLKVNDLTDQIYSSKNKTNAIMILDCCYSGTATKMRGVKGKTTKIKNLKPILDKNFKNKVTKKNGSGKFTITSSANDRESWEIFRDDLYNKMPHSHGAFTYYLLEGLRGGAADHTTGEISLQNLHQYIEQHLPGENKQQPYSAASQAINTNAIRIALSIEQHEKYISTIEKIIESYFPQTDSSFPSIIYIIEGARKLEELKDKDLKNSKITIFNEVLSSKLEEYKTGVITWCDNLPNNIKIQLGQRTETRDVVDLISRIVGGLQFDSISIIGENLSQIIDLIGNEVKNNTRYNQDLNDLKVKTFLMRFTALYKGFQNNNILP